MSQDEQQHRGGFVPVGELADTLPGFEARGRAMSAQAPAPLHHAPPVGFMARLLALCSLPRTNQGDRLQHVRRNGPYTLVMTATGLHKLPYGTLPASRTVPPWSESKAKGNSLSPVSRDTLTPGKRRVAAPCRQRQRVTSRGSRFSSRSTRRSVSSLSVLTSIAPVSAGCSPVGSVGAIFVGASRPFNFARRPHDRECQPASRNTPLRVQRQRLRVQLVDPRILHRHRIATRDLCLPAQPFKFGQHVIPCSPDRDVLDLLHGPLDADIVRIRILPRSILGQLLSDDAVGCPSQAVSHSRKAAHSDAFYLTLGPRWQRPDGGLTLPRGRSGDLSAKFTRHGVITNAGLSYP